MTRYLSVTFNVRGRDLGSVEEAMDKIHRNVKLPAGYRLEWSGEYESKQRADQRLLFVVPITILIIFIILYTMFRSAKWNLGTALATNYQSRCDSGLLHSFASRLTTGCPSWGWPGVGEQHDRRCGSNQPWRRHHADAARFKLVLH
jgi:hypothetical protein